MIWLQKFTDVVPPIRRPPLGPQRLAVFPILGIEPSHPPIQYPNNVSVFDEDVVAWVKIAVREEDFVVVSQHGSGEPTAVDSDVFDLHERGILFTLIDENFHNLVGAADVILINGMEMALLSFQQLATFLLLV